MYFPNFIFLRKRLKSSHTSLKKLEKEDFNSINRYFISSLGDASPPGEDAFLPLLYKEFYLLSFQVAPSFVSFTSNP